MLDHVTIAVRDLQGSKRFFERAFQPLGYRVAFGEEGVFWAFDVGEGTLFEIREAGENETVTRCHVAFRVGKEQQVRAFHDAAIAAGGTDNGGAGLRPNYSEHYFACFVLDPDGHNIEAVCHGMN
ncbi:MAG: VOC family protein [Pseudomonadaceae bacterium]|nr:VOC family protein [Pseudomonadaceae bacterium]